MKKLTENTYMTVNEFKKQYEKKSLKKIPTLDKNFDYLTTEECAECLKTTPQEISALCRGGYFEGAFKIGTSWRIPIKKRAEKMLVLKPKQQNFILSKTAVSGEQ